jgi:hypothetical protein
MAPAGLRRDCGSHRLPDRAHGPCTPPENGGRLALAARRRPSSIHAGIASGSAPAWRHSIAAWRASDPSMSVSLVPPRSPPPRPASLSGRPRAPGAPLPPRPPRQQSARATWHGASPRRSARLRGYGQPAGDHRPCIRVSPVQGTGRHSLGGVIYQFRVFIQVQAEVQAARPWARRPVFRTQAAAIPRPAAVPEPAAVRAARSAVPLPWPRLRSAGAAAAPEEAPGPEHPLGYRRPVRRHHRDQRYLLPWHRRLDHAVRQLGHRFHG